MVAATLLGPTTAIAARPERGTATVLGLGGFGARLVRRFAEAHPRGISRCFVGLVDRSRDNPATYQFEVLGNARGLGGGPLIVVAALGGRDGGPLSRYYADAWTGTWTEKVKAVWILPFDFENRRRPRAMEQLVIWSPCFDEVAVLDNDRFVLDEVESFSVVLERGSRHALSEIRRVAGL